MGKMPVAQFTSKCPYKGCKVNGGNILENKDALCSWPANKEAGMIHGQHYLAARDGLIEAINFYGLLRLEKIIKNMIVEEGGEVGWQLSLLEG